MKYDYLIVGAGLYGSVFAYEAKKKNKKCLVIDKRPHKGGNIYCENVNGINVHKYGAHIFHTNDKGIWDYVNALATFNNYINSPIAISEGDLFNLPFNMNTFHQMWGVKSPADALKKIQEQTSEYSNISPSNLEEQALKLVGRDIYQRLIKGYTEKQWGRDAKELPAFIIKRLPLRFTYNNNYFNDKYQGIPEGGYNKITEKLLEGIEVKTNVNFFEERSYWEEIAKKIVYTGNIDQYFNYEEGKLAYRSLEFKNEILETDNFQGNAVVNYTDREVPFTRIIEHKHFEFGTQNHTVITREYPKEWKENSEPYYPINDQENTKIFNGYKARASSKTNVIFGGRLAEYRYYDMHQVIAAALTRVKKEFEDES